MRTPEQRLTFQLDRLNVAQSAKDRAERKIGEAREKKVSALLYANNNVGHAEREITKTNSKLEAARKALFVAHDRANASPELEKALQDVAKAKQELENATARLLQAQSSKSKDIVSDSPGIQYAQSLVETFERSLAVSKSKLDVVKLEVVTTESRYDTLIEKTIAIRDDLERKRKAVESDYLEAFDIVEFNERKALEESRKNDPNYN